VIEYAAHAMREWIMNLAGAGGCLALNSCSKSLFIFCSAKNYDVALGILIGLVCGLVPVPIMKSELGATDGNTLNNKMND
jgi:hypothetical protein